MDPRRDHSCIEHGVHRWDCGKRRVARSSNEPERDCRGRAMGDRSVCTPALGAPAGRRFARRSLRASPSFSDRHCALRVRIGCVRISGQHSSTHRRSRCAGTWCGAPCSGQSCYHQQLVFRGPTRTRHRHLVGVQRDHSRDRASDRWLADRARILAGSVLY